MRVIVRIEATVHAADMYISDNCTAVAWSRSVSHLLSLSLSLFPLSCSLVFIFSTHFSACILFCYPASGYIEIIYLEFSNGKAVGGKFHSIWMNTHIHCLFLNKCYIYTYTYTYIIYTSISILGCISILGTYSLVYGFFPRNLNPWDPWCYSGPECSCHYIQYKAAEWTEEENPDQRQHYRQERLSIPEQNCR